MLANVKYARDNNLVKERSNYLFLLNLQTGHGEKVRKIIPGNSGIYITAKPGF
jgi:hypothetical protein